ncbi:GRAM domain-containing protein 2A [Puma concolor]|nr:GRAM domain-containing protein 2A [Puma concolor]
MGQSSSFPPKRLLVSLQMALCGSRAHHGSAGGSQGHLVQTVASWEAGCLALHIPFHFKAAATVSKRELSTLLTQVFSDLPVEAEIEMKIACFHVSNLQNNQQMHGKTASLKSPVSCTEKLARVQAPLNSSLHWPEGLKSEEIKKCGREGTLLSKYNQQYHKLFKDIPLEEVVLKVCSCALQRDLLLQGRLYISPNWLCFHASLFGKDIKVVIPVVSVQMIKKHKMARLLPNGLAITTNTSQKYVFVSLLSRDSVYDMLRRVCTHLQPSSKKSLSVREFPEEPECESLEVLIPEMKWRKVCPASRSLSLPDNIPCIPRASMDSTDSFFPSRKPPGSENAVCEKEKLEELPRSDGELRLWDCQLLKVIFVLICFLVMSSSYLAFRISRLEQQLCSLNWDGPIPGHR